MANPASRRGFLAALSASPVAFAAPASASSGEDPAETAFLRWLDLIGAFNAGSPSRTDNQGDLEIAPAEAAEAEIPLSPPTPAKAAVLVTHELAYRLDESRDQSIGQMLADTYDGGVTRLILRLAQCLAPLASDQVARLLVDLDDPDRLTTDTLLWRLYAGEATR